MRSVNMRSHHRLVTYHLILQGDPCPPPSDPSLHRPTHFLQQPALENAAVLDQAGVQDIVGRPDQESKRIEEMVAPLSTARLRQTRQKTKNAVANITGFYHAAADMCLIPTLRRWRGVHGVPEGAEGGGTGG